MTHPTGWPTAQSICDIPEVRKLIDAFAEDSHEENMLAMVSAIMGHSPASVRAAALEEAAQVAEATYIKDPFKFELGTEAAKAIRALSAAPAGGLVDPIIATWPAEIWLNVGDEPLAPFDEHSEINGAVHRKANTTCAMCAPPSPPRKGKANNVLMHS